MQLECSDESLACSVGLQSTPSSVVGATVGGREILSAANGSVAVEDHGDKCLVTTWAASGSDVGAGSAWRLAYGDGQLQLRGQPLRFSDSARDPAFSRVLVNVVSGIERRGRIGLCPNRSPSAKGAGIANTNQWVSRST
jgi:hypothetical protein